MTMTELTPYDGDDAPHDFDPAAIRAAARDAGRRRAIIGLIAAFLVVFVGIVAVQWAVDTDDDQPEAGAPFPQGTLTTLDGEPFELSSIVGTPTVVNFFASWCAPCKAEMPAFEAVYQEVRGEVAFVGINTRETDENDARALIEETGVTYTVLLGDDRGRLVEEVKGLAMPTTVFVNADGTIAEVHSGVLDDDGLRDMISEITGR